MAQKWRNQGTTPSREEADEINDARAESLQKFEAFVAELTLDYERGADDGNPFRVANPKEFWLDCLASGVHHVLVELESLELTQEEKEAGEDVGVVW
ncbi:hypothetical protein MCOR25_010141 [Pyricularia grisea]|nr:hypothetical protein MCOR25_010141 [Pyricularia grisea]